MARAQPQAGWQREDDRAEQGEAKKDKAATEKARVHGLKGDYPRAGYRDVLDAPPDKVAEVVHGRLHTMPRPSMFHAKVGSSLVRKLGGFFHDDGDGGGRANPGGWWIIYEPEVHFGKEPSEDILVPDIAGWRQERMPEYPDDAAYATLAPDWVCEILSPSTRHLDLTGKSDIYAREGVPHFWLVDPETRSLEAFELREGEWTQIASLAGEARVSVPPFDAASFPLGTLWHRGKLLH